MNRQSAKGSRCPTCRKDVDRSESPAFPFCSERCRTIDLGNWLGETYRIPTRETPDEDSSDDSSN